MYLYFYYAHFIHLTIESVVVRFPAVSLTFLSLPRGAVFDSRVSRSTHASKIAI